MSINHERLMTTDITANSTIVISVSAERDEELCTRSFGSSAKIGITYGGGRIKRRIAAPSNIMPPRSVLFKRITTPRSAPIIPSRIAIKPKVFFQGISRITRSKPTVSRIIIAVGAEMNDVTESIKLRDPSKSENEWIIDKEIPIFKGDGRRYIDDLVFVGE